MNQDSLRERVQHVLDTEIRGRLKSHMGDAHIHSISADGDVVLKFQGFCSACPNRPLTYGGLIIPKIEGIEGVRSVSVDGLHVSPFVMDSIRKLGSALPRTAGAPRRPTGGARKVTLL